MSAISFRSVVLVARIIAGLCAGASLALFGIIIAKVFDERFPATEPAVTALPAFALSCAILWNTIAIATRSRIRIYAHIVGDLVAAGLLLVLGAVGFAHDDKYYLGNGIWRQYDNADWLVTETGAGALMLVSFIIQLFLAALSWYQYRLEKQEVLKRGRTFGGGDDEAHNQWKGKPIYEQKESVEKKTAEAGMDLDQKSFGTSETSSYVDLGEKS